MSDVTFLKSISFDNGYIIKFNVFFSIRLPLQSPFTIINHHLSLSAKQLTNNDNNDCSEMVSWYDKAIAECLTYFFESPPKDLATIGEEGSQSSTAQPMIALESDWETWSWLSRLIVSKANLLVEFKR